jgi:hypothetical protein
MRKFFIAFCLFAVPLFSTAQSELPEILHDVEVLDMGYCWTVLFNDEDFYEELYKHPVEYSVYNNDNGTQTDVREFDGLLVLTYHHASTSEWNITYVTKLY